MICLRRNTRFPSAIFSTNTNMDWMNQHGLTVFLRISQKAVVDRLVHAKRKRPLAEGKSEEELAAFVEQHYTGRLPFYEQSRITVKAEDLDLDSLVKQIEELRFS